MNRNWLRRMVMLGTMAAGGLALAQSSGGIAIPSPDSKAAQHPAGPQGDGTPMDTRAAPSSDKATERSNNWDRQSAARSMGNSTNSDSTAHGRVTATPPADSALGTGGAGGDAAAADPGMKAGGTHAKSHKKHGKGAKSDAAGAGTDTSSGGSGSTGTAGGGTGSTDTNPK